MQFPDGRLPPKEMIKEWLQVVDDFFSEKDAEDNKAVGES